MGIVCHCVCLHVRSRAYVCMYVRVYSVLFVVVVVVVVLVVVCVRGWVGGWVGAWVHACVRVYVFAHALYCSIWHPCISLYKSECDSPLVETIA